MSPSRGVFVFAPIVAFSVWGMVVAWRSSARHAALLRILAAAVVVHWIMISVLARKWWAGWSFGPRHVVEVFPLLIVLLVPALDAMRAAPRPLRAALASLGAVALAWSAFAAVHGARSPAPSAWSATPRSVDAHPERLWDWRDMQILRGVGR